MSYAEDYADFEQSAQGEEHGKMKSKEMDFYEYCERIEGTASEDMSCSELANARWRFKQGWHKK